MKFMKLDYCFWLVLLILSYHSGHASHLRAGEIVVKQSNCQEGIFSITLILYGDKGSPINPGDGKLSFGDGSIITVPSGNFVLRSDLPPTVGIFVFTIDHKFTLPGLYTISYSEANRNGGILNIQNSSNTFFFIETLISFNKQICNNSPKLLAPPIDKACSRLSFFHNPAAFDEEGDSLAFTLATPLSAIDQLATYLPPNHSSFYTDFNRANEAANGQPRFTIDPLTGTITWDAPGAVGEYNVSFIVEEWRKVNNVFIKLGSVRRDMQILVEECNNKRPELTIPKDICVIAGTTISENIFGSDPDLNGVKIEMFSGVFSLPNNPASFSPNPPVFQSSVPVASTSFLWTPSCEEVRNQPYQVTIKITDNPPIGPGLVRFKVWNIKVVAPPPVLNNAGLDIIQKKATITWSSYVCPNATKIQIWRRVDSYKYNPDDCTSGLPKYAGYTKISEVSSDNTQYIDDNNGMGLAVGAVYCYRLTALFPRVDGAESKVSFELCLPPILADAPVITQVSVAKTDEKNGEMIISWRSPYDLSQFEFLKPYEYVLLRSKGLTGDAELTKVNSANILDTAYTDKAINTQDFPYNYRIVLLARSVNNSSLIPIDTSSIASSVWNNAIPQSKSIELNWQANTPWSNVMQNDPWHLIYRYDENSAGNNLILIDSVNVAENGFYYLDTGSFQGKGLNDSEFYCYRIRTRGTYGNSSIQSPLENFSQVICSTTLDTTPPCKPSIVKEEVNCDLFNSQTPCLQKIFSNTIHWMEPLGECRKDVYKYRVYGANSSKEEFSLLGSVLGNEFIETGLNKLSRCYKITAVDRSGNESEFSDVVCYDNCPSIFISNVITPNGDNYNEKFELFNTDEFCSRFIDHIILSVFNRWGQKIANIQNEGTLLWDGNDASGNPVSAGVYYFNADVVFDTLEPSKGFKQIKGWVHIIR